MEVSKRCVVTQSVYSILRNLTLLCRLSIKIKVSGIKCLLKILLVIGYASIMGLRPKTSRRNLTGGFHCVVFHLIVLAFGCLLDS